jgi:hypothetical protein
VIAATVKELNAIHQVSFVRRVVCGCAQFLSATREQDVHSTVSRSRWRGCRLYVFGAVLSTAHEEVFACCQARNSSCAVLGLP